MRSSCQILGELISNWMKKLRWNWLHNVCFKKTMTPLLLYTVVSVSSFLWNRRYVSSNILTDCTNSYLNSNKVAICYFFYTFWIVKCPSIYRNNNVLKSRNLILTTQIISCGRDPRSTLDFKKVERYIPQLDSRKSP